MNKSNMNKDQIVTGIPNLEIRPPVVTFVDMSLDMKEFAF